MTLTLYILRHAHATHDPSFADFDRPLTAGGVREAAEMGALMAERDFRPARILCSSAQRTRETLIGVLAALDHECRIDVSRELYDASDERLLRLVAEEDDTPSLMLVGHNPGLEQLARALSGSGDERALRGLRAKFPPGALAVIEFDMAGWRDLAPGKGRLVAFEVPAG